MGNYGAAPGLAGPEDWLLLDGGLATELERRGADLRDHLWSARLLRDDPGLIRAVHLDYLRAGADVLIGASYQASFEGFAQLGLGWEETEQLLRRSVALAAAARSEFWQDETNREGRRRPLIAASVGPYGAMLADGSEYRGDYGLSVTELMNWHRPRLAVLADSGADLLACETIPCLAEGEALCRLLEEFPGVPAWLCFSCRDGERLCHGELFSETVALAGTCRSVVAVGVNCTPPHYVESLLRSAAGRAPQPFVAYPNSGESWDAARHCWVEAPGEPPFAALARRWYDAGARLIGGCCRTGPEEIRAIRKSEIGNRKSEF